MHDHEEARLSRLVLMPMVIQVVAPVRLRPTQHCGEAWVFWLSCFSTRLYRRAARACVKSNERENTVYGFTYTSITNTRAAKP